MVSKKIYLNVPYAEKDAAKALGAKWDAAKKKWYAPGDKDIALFSKWQSSDVSYKSTTTINTKKTSSTQKATRGTITHAKDKDFVAYNGDKPPWD